ncbi:hypothetical protein FOL47_008095 [Perkinsus chesapeaki]|uniref:Uncharacterized protein n=1 Tax=Perkinsus chesapeaki TaxID=330153 RepID=A0A7J6LG87_PERCH|nr:hypothetical protein FOL47_008095 [Perkinsus chesapeaki]
MIHYNLSALDVVCKEALEAILRPKYFRLIQPWLAISMDGDKEVLAQLSEVLVDPTVALGPRSLPNAYNLSKSLAHQVQGSLDAEQLREGKPSGPRCKCVSSKAVTRDIYKNADDIYRAFALENRPLRSLPFAHILTPTALNKIEEWQVSSQGSTAWPNKAALERVLRNIWMFDASMPTYTGLLRVGLAHQTIHFSLGATCDVKALLESRLDEEAPGWKKSKKVKKSAINKVVNKLAEEIEENSRKGISADDDSADDAGGVQCDELPSSVAFDIPFGPSSEREPVARALQGLAMKMDCLQRLQRARPSTAGIGNWAIEDVLRHHRLDVRTVLGRAVLGERKPLISTTDKRAWDKFKGEFTKHDCMIIHVNNHYAMVFAYRERDNLKEVLTAKKGQKPKYWVDWTHVIAALNKWQGYGVSGINKMDTAEGQHLESKQGGTFEDSNFNQT